MLVDEALTISLEEADAYQAAVDCPAALYQAGRVVSPMAVAALAMAAAMRAVQLPAGTVHTGQELESHRPVLPGTPLRCTAKVAQNSVRKGTRFLSLQFRVASKGETAVDGETSLAIPVEASAW